MTHEDIATEVCRTVAELPDRNSPEDWPEAMLVTADELRSIVMAALSTNAGEAAPADDLEKRYRFLLSWLIEHGVLTNKRYSNGTWVLRGIYGVDDSGLKGAGLTPEQAVDNAIVAHNLERAPYEKFWQDTHAAIAHSHSAVHGQSASTASSLSNKEPHAERTLENDPRAAQDARPNAGAVGGTHRDGAHEHHQHRAGQTDAHGTSSERDSRSAGVSSENPVRKGLAALVADLLLAHEDGDSPTYLGDSILLERLRASIATPPAAIPAAPMTDEHYVEVKATLEGLHALMGSLSAMERRIGTLGSHARGYTHKITAALRHLDAIAFAAPVQQEAEAVTPEMISAGAAAAREYMERTGGSSPEAIYRAMRRAALQPTQGAGDAK